MWLYILLGCLFSRMTGNMHFCTKSKKDFPHVTLVFEDGKWVEAHKMILAASSCLCLAENSKKKHPHPLIFMRRIQSNIQYSGYFRFLKDSKPPSYPNSVRYFLRFYQFLEQCERRGTKSMRWVKALPMQTMNKLWKNLTATTVLKIHKLFHSGAKPKR